MKSGAAFLLAILLAVFLAAGQCGSGSSGSSKDDSDHASSASDNSEDEHDKDSDDKKKDDKKKDDKDSDKKDDKKDSSPASDMKKRLESQGLTVEDSRSTSDEDCAGHSYGEVSGYFDDHPCKGLDRAWYEISDGKDNTAVMSVAWVEMPDPDGARGLQKVVDRPGTGNVTELSKEDGPYGAVTYSGWYYRSDVDNDTFISLQAEPLEDSDGSRAVARKAAGATATD